MIKLIRNSEHDANFSVHEGIVEEGEVVELLSITPFHFGVPATITFNVSKNKEYAFLNPFIANLNCFNYVKGDL